MPPSSLLPPPPSPSSSPFPESVADEPSLATEPSVLGGTADRPGRTILFIHGMFMTGKSWERWLPLFEARGYRCIDADWPLHEGDPQQLRALPPAGLGELSLDVVLERFAGLAAIQDPKPILIGHSVGGLIVQLLVSQGLASAGVCISSVAPNRMLAFDWEFAKHSALITNPLKGSATFEMTPERFHESFANTLTREESDRLHHAYAVHDSRNILRDCLGRLGQIEISKPHAPLLFVSGESDRIIPPALNERNAEGWDHPDGIVDYQTFPERSHAICIEPGWREVAGEIEMWLETHAPA